MNREHPSYVPAPDGRGNYRACRTCGKAMTDTSAVWQCREQRSEVRQRIVDGGLEVER